MYSSLLYQLFSHRGELGIFKAENLGYIVQFWADRPHFRARWPILNFTDRIFDTGELPRSMWISTLEPPGGAPCVSEAHKRRAPDLAGPEMQCASGRWNMKVGVVVAADIHGQTKDSRLKESDK